MQLHDTKHGNISQIEFTGEYEQIGYNIFNIKKIFLLIII